MEYTELTEADRYRITQAKLRQYEQRHATAVIDHAAAEAAGETAQAKGLAAQIAKWEQAAGAARALLADLPAPDPGEPRGRAERPPR